MPQKYGKHMRPLPGFRANEELLKQINQKIAERRQKQADKRLRRKFLAEPEELKVLDAIESLPDSVRLDAAEAALISRVARRKKLIK